MKSLAQDGLILKNIGNGREVFVLVDNDKEGRDLLKSGRLGRDGGGLWVKHNSNKTHWCRLKISDDFSQEMKILGIPEVSWPYTIENCFAKEIHNEAIEKGKLKFEKYPHDELIKCDKSKKIVIPLSTSNEHTYILTPHPEYKVPFAHWIVDKADIQPSILEPFKLIFERMLRILQTAKATTQP